jgi:hypothetical protein
VDERDFEAVRRNQQHADSYKSQKAQTDDGRGRDAEGGLDQKSIRNTERRLIQAEAEAVAGIVGALPAVQGDAHAPITREQARSVALAMYFVLGELATRTDMTPVEQLPCGKATLAFSLQKPRAAGPLASDTVRIYSQPDDAALVRAAEALDRR